MLLYDKLERPSPIGMRATEQSFCRARAPFSAKSVPQQQQNCLFRSEVAPYDTFADTGGEFTKTGSLRLGMLRPTQVSGAFRAIRHQCLRYIKAYLLCETT